MIWRAESDAIFHYATDEEIRNGETTDVYFARTKKILEAKGLKNLQAVAEVTSSKLPGKWPWGIICGIGGRSSPI